MCSESDVIEFNVLSSVPLDAEDLAATRNAALEKGLNRAVLRAVEDMVPIEALAQGLQGVGEAVLGYGQGLVKEYRLLAQAQTKDRYILLLKVSMVRRDLENALTAAGVQIGPPEGSRSVLVFLQGDPREEKAIREVVARSLSRSRSRMIDAGSAGFDVSKLSVATWADLGRQKDADLVLYCAWKSECKPSESGIPATRCYADAETRLVDVALGALLDRSGVEVKTENPDPAVAGEKNLTDLVSELDQLFLAQENKAKSFVGQAMVQIKVRIDKVTTYAQFEKVRDALRNRIPGVTSVQLYSIVPGQFQLIVTYPGSAEVLARRLSNLYIEGVSISAAAKGDNDVTVSILSSGGAR